MVWERFGDSAPIIESKAQVKSMAGTRLFFFLKHSEV
jgi:hypothetical protein